MTDREAPVPETTGHERAETEAISRTHFDQIPAELQGRNQWVCWQRSADAQGRPRKVPINPQSGRPASVTDPATWSTFTEAAAASNAFHGVGFVLAAADPYVGIDLDGCIEPDGTIAPWARAIIDRLRSYTEISPSGTGIHIIVRANLPRGRRRLHIGGSE
jgi:putative DNA primase/helicase